MRGGVLLSLVLAAGPALAQTAPYSGQQERDVSSFSAEDLEQLRAGAGWGLAKPAELNGWPGPRHVLDLADELGLSEAQQEEVQAVYDAMRAQAVEQGQALIAAEVALDAAFASGEIDEDSLVELLGAAERARAELRQTHLSAHLALGPVLTRHQKMTYNSLRGYGDSHGHAGHTGH
ncbi:Spy/CpxP family protein refolding chaperone [Ruegeria aquimaris]|uniref:Spy/CpxP family protein refolding chaperone n=1 Tax=Ruegeria aquimaris TaxID=2984333 RepID=A0ABT3AI79_9RHOB|nr:periplasmic heavy metal sensor [Ruegeria sp. XHP0148]MCV2888384.1 Spy/CpxP family protein refolding chaperone [Ruegeria sp. XHP0148]